MAQSLNFTEIKDSCSNLTNLASSLDGTIDNLTSAVSKVSNPAWEGKASTNYRDKITALVNKLPEARQQLALSVFFLANSANAYEQIGEENVKKLKDLIGGQDYIDNYDVSNLEDVKFDTTPVTPPVENTTTPVETTTTTATTTTTWSTSTGANTTLSTNYTGTPGTYTGGTRYTYSVGDGNTSSSGVYSGALVSAAATTSTLVNLSKTADTDKVVEIPKSVRQGYYTCTGYDYWINTGREMTWKAGTNQRTVSEIWKQQGSVFKNGIAVINVDGVDRYLIAVTTKFGMPGDCIDVVFEDGTVVPCIIGDSKGDGSGSGSEWGHALPNGSVNVLEFEVQREKILQSGNPTTEKWNLPWNSDCPVAKMKNTGSIIGAKVTEKTVLTGKIQTDGNVIKASSPIDIGTQYELSDDDIAYLAHVAKREQGSVEGAKLELSLMANLYEKNKTKYKNVVDYVKNSGWFSTKSTSSYTNPGADYVQAAKEVISEGNRYLPTNVVEHDCLSDISSISTGSVNDRSNYIPGETVIKNKYGANYVFVGFAPDGGDPFGYLV